LNQINKTEFSEATTKLKLLKWCRDVVEEYKVVNVTNFDSR